MMWLLTGSLPLFTIFGIRVRAHASLVLTIALVLLLGLGPGFGWQDRVQSMSILFLIVLLHEFGHCFAARWVGGQADEIVMHPLGGLALAQAPRRPWPTFVTVAGGPAVNVVICLICGAILYALSGWVPWNPFGFTKPIRNFEGWLDVWRYSYWIYQISFTLLIFNLLPIFPLDGGQMLQSILWPKFGYYKSMNFACVTGMIGAVLGGMVALATFNFMLALLAYFGFMTCLSLRRQLLAAGPWGVEEDLAYQSAYESQSRSNSNASRRAHKKIQKQEQSEKAEQRRVDEILAKVSAHGMQSLTWLEKRVLRKATEHQRERETPRLRKR